MSWTEPETWIALALAFGLGMGAWRGGRAVRDSLRPRARRRRRYGPESLEPEPYDEDRDGKRSDGSGGRHSE